MAAPVPPYSVHVDQVGRAYCAGRRSGHDHDLIALAVSTELQQRLVHLEHHRIGGGHLGHEEGLGSPAQRELRTHLGDGGEGEKWQRCVQSGEPSYGVTGRREGDESLRVQTLADIARGVGDDASLGARDMRERRDPVALGLDGLDDAGHRSNRFHDVLAHGGLAGQHDRVGAVEHGVRDVGCFGSGGTGVLDHRFEHLGRDDDRLGVGARNLNGTLLHQGHLFERQLHAEITAGNHDRVEGQHDRLEVVDGFRLLELGDDRNPAPHTVHDGVHELDVGR